MGHFDAIHMAFQLWDGVDQPTLQKQPLALQVSLDLRDFGR